MTWAKRISKPVPLNEAIQVLTTHLERLVEHYAILEEKTKERCLFFGYIQYIQAQINTKKLISEQITLHEKEINRDVYE